MLGDLMSFFNSWMHSSELCTSESENKKSEEKTKRLLVAISDTPRVLTWSLNRGLGPREAGTEWGETGSTKAKGVLVTVEAVALEEKAQALGCFWLCDLEQVI